MFMATVSSQAENTALDFDEMYEKHSNMVWMMICKRIFDVSHRQDVMQEVFMQFSKAIHTFRHEGAAVNWLKVTTERKITDFQRKNGTYTKYICTTLDDENTYESPNDRLQETLDEHIIQQEEKAIVQKIMNQLSDKHREVIRQHYFLERTPNEIAEDLMISVNTVYSRLDAAEKKLEKLMRNAGLEGGTEV